MTRKPQLKHGVIVGMMPILYSFRRCPYAIRARMALAYAGIEVELREVVLRDKPAAMLALSPKGTVPVLQLDETVLEESIDIFDWALGQHDPQTWIDPNTGSFAAVKALVAACDFEFKPALDYYKYADRHPEHSQLEYRQVCEEFLQTLEDRLSKNEEGGYLFGDQLGYADVAIFPFVRQFALVDKDWFDASPYPRLQQWLAALLGSELFESVMHKQPQWQQHCKG